MVDANRVVDANAARPPHTLPAAPEVTTRVLLDRSEQEVVVVWLIPEFLGQR